MKKVVDKFSFGLVVMMILVALVAGRSNPARGANTNAEPCDRSLLDDDSLSVCYGFNGISKKDLKWLRGLANNGNPHAEYTLGGLYLSGTGVQQSLLNSLNWYRKAYESGDTRAKSAIQQNESLIAGVALDSHDTGKFLYWEKKAAEDGNVGVQFELWNIYNQGDISLGIKPNAVKAVYWGRKVEASEGSETMEFMLGLAYMEGKGVSRDYQEAASWFRKAAARGAAEAEHNLGIMYMKGEGIAVNPGAAADWFYKAGIAYLKEGDRDDALEEVGLIKILQEQYGDLLPNGFLGKELIAQIYAPAATSRPTSHPGQTPQPVLNEGTGWLVAGGFIVTNHHVIAGADAIWIRTASGIKMKASIVADDPNNDLALLKVATPARLPPALPLASGPAPVGESVFALGYPEPDIMGGDIKLTSGVISASAGANDDPRLYQTSTEIQPGSSGSPLLDMRGEVVGIMTSSLNAAKILKLTGNLPQDVNYAIKVVYLKALLQSVQHTEEVHELPVQSDSLEHLDKRIAPSVIRVFAEVPASKQN